LGAGGLVGEAAFVEQQEKPLGPAVVVGVGRVDFAFPVVAAFCQGQLAAVVAGILFGGDCRVNAHFDGKVFGGQTEGIPAHRVQHVETLHAFHTGNNIGRHVIAQMPYRETVA